MQEYLYYLTKLTKEKRKSVWHYVRDIREEAYDEAEQFVAEKIAIQEQPFFKFSNDVFVDHSKETNKIFQIIV